MPQGSFQSLREQADTWASSDPDVATSSALRAIVESGDESRLRACFEPEMEFGTAGLRGVVGPGPAQMNVAVIRRVTRALSDVVQARSGGETLKPIVLGFDGRLDSRRFAQVAVSVLAGAGQPVAFFGAPVPTPLVAFAGLKLSAAASVVVTASHNPPEYNGYKVYGAEAIQIIPPFDNEVKVALAHVSPAREIAVEPDAFSGNSWNATELGEATIEDYIQTVVGGRVPAATTEPLRIAYSPLHGVGAPCFERVMQRAGYRDLHVEPSQRDVDGHFTTVRFPNPEEPATLERGLALAKAIEADVLIVNDPDADRMGTALPDADGNFRILSGNEIGIILTDYLLSHAPAPKTALVVSTLVSTPMTRLVVESYGAHFEQTLTGFKWLWTAVRALEAERGLTFSLCWEEALGYSTHRAVRDKDGIAAGLTLADWVSECKIKGRLPIDRLGDLYRKHGAWGSSPMNLTLPGILGIAQIERMLARLSSSPPASLLGRKLLGMTDYSEGEAARPVYQGVARMYVLEFEGDARIVVRPSGTEPKLKLYSDVREVVVGAESPFVAYERARAMAGLLAEALVQYLR